MISFVWLHPRACSSRNSRHSQQGCSTKVWRAGKKTPLATLMSLAGQTTIRLHAFTMLLLLHPAARLWQATSGMWRMLTSALMVTLSAPLCTYSSIWSSSLQRARAEQCDRLALRRASTLQVETHGVYVIIARTAYVVAAAAIKRKFD